MRSNEGLGARSQTDVSPPHTSGKEDGITIYVFLLETDIPTSGFGPSTNGQSESERE